LSSEVRLVCNWVVSRYGVGTLELSSKTKISFLKNLRYRVPVIFGIVILAFLLRSWNLGWGLPHLTHPDEAQYAHTAIRLFHRGELNPRFFNNPPFYTYAILAGMKTVCFWEEITGTVDSSRTFIRKIFPDPTKAWLIARLLSALFGTAAVILAARIAGRFGGNLTRFGAALALAVCFLHVRDSHYAVNDMMACFLLTTAILFSLRAVDLSSIGNAVLAGIFAGLAIATKYNSGVVLAVLPAAIIIHRFSAGNGLRPGFSSRAIISFMVAAIIFFIVGCPWVVLTPDIFRNGFLEQLSMGRLPWLGQTESSPVVMGRALLQGFGWPLLLLAGMGAVILWRQGKATARALLVFLLLYLGMMSLSRLMFARRLIPILPVVAVLGGRGMESLLVISRRRWSRAAAAAFCILALAVPLRKSIHHNLLLGREDTRIRAARWVLDNIPPETIIARDHYSPDFHYADLFSDGYPRKPYPLINLQIGGRDRFDRTTSSLEYLRRSGVRYIILSSFMVDRFRGFSGRYPDRNAFVDSIEKGGRLVHVESPFLPGHNRFNLDDIYSPFYTVMTRISPGPVVWIYRL
jgi:Dolichyl-phosphate-mannose-protein mannosyltransferase